MYYILILSFIYGIYQALEKMSSCKSSGQIYREPKNLLDFILNEQTK
jgi:hypothetical protein